MDIEKCTKYELSNESISAINDVIVEVHSKIDYNKDQEPSVIVDEKKIVNNRLLAGMMLTNIAEILGTNVRDFGYNLTHNIGYVYNIKAGRQPLSNNVAKLITKVASIDNSAIIDNLHTISDSTYFVKKYRGHDAMNSESNIDENVVVDFNHIVTKSYYKECIDRLRGSNYLQKRFSGVRDTHAFMCRLQIYQIHMELAIAIKSTIAGLSNELYGNNQIVNRFSEGRCSLRSLDGMVEKLRDKFDLSNEAVSVLEKLVDGCKARNKGTIDDAPIRFGSFEPWPEEDILNKIEAIESPDEEIETVEETEVETIDEPEIETVEDDEIEVSLDSAETEPIEEIHPDRYRFKNQPEEYSNKESTFGMILSRLAFTQGISISSLADMAGLTIDEMKDICNDKTKMSIYHILRLEQSLKMNDTDAHRLERLADCDAEIPLYIKKYISDPKIAKVLSQVAEAKLPYLCWEKLLKDLR